MVPCSASISPSSTYRPWNVRDRFTATRGSGSSTGSSGSHHPDRNRARACQDRRNRPAASTRSRSTSETRVSSQIANASATSGVQASTSRSTFTRPNRPARNAAATTGMSRRARDSFTSAAHRPRV